MEREAVLNIPQETRAFLARPENNFDWSFWANGEAALKEIDSLIASVRAGILSDPRQFVWFFGPTGPVQEVSLSSGWGDEFLELATRIDAATR